MSDIQETAGSVEAPQVSGKSEHSAKPAHWLDAAQNGSNDDIKHSAKSELRRIISKYSLSNYQILFLFDIEDSISHWYSNQIYSAAGDITKDSPDILLLIDSTGGAIEPAYLISKALRRLSLNKFSVVVPR